MSRTKKPRTKTYRPKAIVADVAFDLLAAKNAHDQMVVNFDKPLSEEQQRDISLVFGMGIDTMATGKGTEEALHNIIFMCNVSLVLCEHGIGPQYEADMVAALDGTFRSKLRGEKTGRWGLDGPALVALRRAFEIHSAQVEVAEHRDFRRALNEVTRRIESGDLYQEFDEIKDMGRAVEVVRTGSVPATQLKTQVQELATAN